MFYTNVPYTHQSFEKNRVGCLKIGFRKCSVSRNTTENEKWHVPSEVGRKYYWSVWLIAGPVTINYTCNWKNGQWVTACANGYLNIKLRLKEIKHFTSRSPGKWRLSVDVTRVQWQNFRVLFLESNPIDFIDMTVLRMRWNNATNYFDICIYQYNQKNVHRKLLVW